MTDTPPNPARAACERTDAERLDWLDRVNQATNAHYRTRYGWKFDLNCNRASLTDHHLPALTVRDAIDSAMDAKS